MVTAEKDIRFEDKYKVSSIEETEATHIMVRKINRMFQVFAAMINYVLKRIDSTPVASNQIYWDEDIKYGIVEFEE